MEGFLTGEVRDLVKRGLFADTCRKYGYVVGTDSKGRTVQIANYRRLDGTLVGQKVRGADKSFYAAGDLGEDAPLYGMQLFRDNGKRVMITEGELDCLSLAQTMGTWPVVSVPKGAAGAKRAIQRNLEWLEGFEDVVFCFDMDEAGRRAARECAAVLTPGKARIWEIPLKDASDMLVAKRQKEMTHAVYDAKTFRPGGVVNGSELWEAMMSSASAPGVPYRWPSLTKMTMGQRPGTIATWVSGTGMGKSTAVSWVGYDNLMGLPFLSEEERAAYPEMVVGHVALEESIGETAERYAAMHLKKRLELMRPKEKPAAMLRPAFEATMGTGRFWTYDHFGSHDDGELMAKIRYLIKGCGCNVIILDHLSIIVSGMDEGNDERKTIDRFCTNLRALAEETGVRIHLVCHLNRPKGDAHEEGGRITLGHLRGSGGIAQISDTVIALERNQQAEDEDDKSTAICRVLKARKGGRTGVACRIRYDLETGEMVEVVDDEAPAPMPAEDLPF